MATVISTPAELYGLMTSTDDTYLANSFVLAGNIDMNGFTCQSIGEDPLHSFRGSFNGTGYTIIIRGVDANYVGFFNTTKGAGNGIIQNLTINYGNSITMVTGDIHGGLISYMNGSPYTVSNCSVIYSNEFTSINAIYSSLLIGTITNSSNIVNCNVIMNNNISISTDSNSSIGLLCGGCIGGDINSCSVTANAGTYNISITINAPASGDIGLLIGRISNSFIPQLFDNNSGVFNNNGGIYMSSTGDVGGMVGKLASFGGGSINISTMTITINNNRQEITGLDDNTIFFGGNTPALVPGPRIIFTYQTTTDNTSLPLTIVPTPLSAPVMYILSYTNTYPPLSDGDYYIPNSQADVSFNTTIDLVSSPPNGITIDSVLYPTGSIYTFTYNGAIYDLIVFGVGSMYFGIKGRVVILTASALYNLMTSINDTNLSKIYVLGNDIDMTGFTSVSIGNAPHIFTGCFDGAGHTVIIRDISSSYVGFFNNIENLIYNNYVKNLTITYAQSINISGWISWGGLIAHILPNTNCSVANSNCIYLNQVQLTTIQNDTKAALFIAYIDSNISTVTGCSVFINAEIQIDSLSSQFNTTGLLCGQIDNGTINSCSVVANSGTYDIIISQNPIIGNPISGLLIAYVTNNRPGVTSYSNNSCIFNNNGSITVNKNPSSLAGAMIGAIIIANTTTITIDTTTININNNQSINIVEDFFGSVGGFGTFTPGGGIIFTYQTTTDNTSRPLTIVPAPTPAPVTYINSYIATYPPLSIGNYYIPYTQANIEFNTTIALASTAPDGITIDSVLYPTGSIYTFTDTGTIYDLTVFGVGSMYFGLKLHITAEAIAAIEACSCDINAIVNPQTGITADSRIVNALEANQIRSSVDQEILTQYVGYPKFKTYRDYALYIQGKLRYR